MGGDKSTRYQYKEVLYSLAQELHTEYGLSAIETRALVSRISEFIDQLQADHQGIRTPGQVQYVAVAAGQPAGRPLSHCVTIPVLLTLISPSDAEVLHQSGTVALRQTRLLRITHEARQQGGLLSYEDLSLLLALDISTIRRQVAQCRKQGLEVPSRGRVADIGPGTSHRHRVIELLFRGLQPNGIAAHTGHALSSVERYISDFARVAQLLESGYPKAAIVRITGLSPRIVREYRSLVERYSHPAHQPVMQMLAQRFFSTTPEKEA